MASDDTALSTERALQDVLRTVLNEVRSASSAELRYRLASDVVLQLRSATTAAATARGAAVGDLRRERGWSLSQVAEHLQLSKARADQLIRAAAREGDHVSQPVDG